jgi:RNA polymerase sigma-70 factor (ECF subfamily)
VAMADGPAAGLAVLDGIGGDGRAEGWHLLHACRADLLRRLGRGAEAAAAYRAALALGPPSAERDFLAARLAELPRRPERDIS